MIRPVALWLTTALALGGCAAAVPGYVPPSAKSEKLKAAAPRGGGFDDAGTYSLSDQEKLLDCKHLSGGITVKIIQMREAQGRWEATAGAKVLQQGMRPIRGGTTYAYDNDEDYRQDRARLEALNRQLAAKGCKTFDLDAELKPGNTATPKPVEEAKRK